MYNSSLQFQSVMNNYQLFLFIFKFCTKDKHVYTAEKKITQSIFREMVLLLQHGGQLPLIVRVYSSLVLLQGHQENPLLYVGGVHGQDPHQHKVSTPRLRNNNIHTSVPTSLTIDMCIKTVSCYAVYRVIFALSYFFSVLLSNGFAQS